MAVSCARKSLSPSLYFCSSTTVPAAAVKRSRKTFASPTLCAEDAEESTAARLIFSDSRANFAITAP